ncbi:MAG TPA: hypothetical protein VHZ78_00065 [Rhizomicrobium sp.]|jgi:hypothetical protein|nr:hypothetical protein [Rhizomicrobium sp.]
MSRQTKSLIAALASAALTLAPLTPAVAGGGGGGYGGHGGGMSTPGCPNMGGHTPPHSSPPPSININKNINIFKPVVINKNININKNIIINKNIVINKVNAFASAQASAFATAASAAQAGAAAQTIVYSGSYQIINYNNRGAGGAIAIAAVHSGGECHMQDATVVKSIHAVCVSAEGREFDASHMIGDTWIDSGYEGEVARCIPGSHLKVIIGDVLQSDQGMAGTYEHGQVLMCADHEALRHFKDGMVKCAPAVPVPDCTERTNLRRWGTGDFFFSFRAKVCVTETHVENTTAEVGGMTLDGGVGETSGY